jgi:hypothetical protein
MGVEFCAVLRPELKRSLEGCFELVVAGAWRLTSSTTNVSIVSFFLKAGSPEKSTCPSSLRISHSPLVRLNVAAIEELFNRITDPSWVIRAWPKSCEIEAARHKSTSDFVAATFTHFSITMAKVIREFAD